MSTPETPETSTPDPSIADPSEDVPTRPDGPGRRPARRDMHTEGTTPPPDE